MYIPAILPICMIFYIYDDRFIFSVFILLVITYLLMIFHPKMPSEFRCPNCQSNEYIDYGELIECRDCGFEFFKEFLYSEIDEDNLMSDQDLEALADSFEDDFKDEMTQKKFLKSIDEDLKDIQE
ncbi:MAG: hypothetical protein ACFFA7_06155 [Promethearchaeota archaeon]